MSTVNRKKYNLRFNSYQLGNFSQFTTVIFYLGESKVLQYFSNVGHNLIVLDAFAEVVKVKNHIGL